MDHKYTGVIHWWLIFPVQSTEIKWTSAKTNSLLWYKSIARVLHSYIYIEDLGSIKIEQCSAVYLIIPANALLWLFCHHLISLHCMFTIFSTAVPCNRMGWSAAEEEGREASRKPIFSPPLPSYQRSLGCVFVHQLHIFAQFIWKTLQECKTALTSH